MSKIIIRRSANKGTKQRASTLAKIMSAKGEAIVYTDVTPRFINLEEKYGHRVIKIGNKGVEITPISEIRPLSIKYNPVSRKQNVKQRKKNRIEKLKGSFMIFAKK